MVTTSSKWQELLGVREVVPGNVAKDAILDVAAKDALLREWHSILASIMSPSMVQFTVNIWVELDLTYLRFLLKNSGLLSLRAICSSR